MQTVKLTSKRQATLPVELCNEMGVNAGDELNVVHKVVDGQKSWILRSKSNKMKWLSSLNKFVKGKSHNIDDIHKSIGRGLAKR